MLQTNVVSRLGQYVILDHSVGIIVPSTMDVDKSIDNADYVQTVCRELSGLFGGATATLGYGGWIAENGQFVGETVTIVTANCTDAQLTDNLSAVLDVAAWIKITMKQESVAILIDGALVLA